MLFHTVSGKGPPVLLLHGFPETHRCWDRVVEHLSDRFTVVRADLPGYGESPRGADAGKRAMADAVRELMTDLGHPRFAAVGHDRGALVATRLALDHPECVESLSVLDIVPVLDMWQSVTAESALAAYHLFLLAQPADLPERLLQGAPDAFVDSFLDGWTTVPGAITPEHRELYHRQFDPVGVCADYRAGAGIDLEVDRADRAAGRRVTAPTLVLWQEPGGAPPPFDPLEIWRRWADDVHGHGLDAGHFLPEERPDEVAAAIAEHVWQPGHSGQPQP